MVLDGLVRGGEGVGEDAGHRQDGRTRVEPEAGLVDDAGAPPGTASRSTTTTS